jgi:hypothetical protein
MGLEPFSNITFLFWVERLVVLIFEYPWMGERTGVFLRISKYFFLLVSL